jgi:hypothetical protein
MKVRPTVGSTLIHDFTVEIKSKQFLRNISISDEARKLVLFDGSLGETVDLSLVEGDVLEITGRNGVLRVSISEDQLRYVLRKHDQMYGSKGAEV